VIHTTILIRAAALTGFIAAVAGAASAADAEAPAPLTLEGYFTGTTHGSGAFNSWIAGVDRAFELTAEGYWDGTTLTLVEDFHFADGARERKTWRFVRTGEGTYIGTREDVVGEAVVTTDDGQIRMTYDLDLPRADGSTIRLHFRDIIERQRDGTVLNTARVTKFGLPIARVEVVFSKPAIGRGGGAAAGQAAGSRSTPAPRPATSQ
jgi:hypothetical protein